MTRQDKMDGIISRVSLKRSSGVIFRTLAYALIAVCYFYADPVDLRQICQFADFEMLSHFPEWSFYRKRIIERN